MELQFFEGIVRRVIFANEERGYTVALLETYEGDEITIVGPMPLLAEGEELSVEGEMVTHVRHGEQLLVHSCERHMPTDISGIIAYLGSGAIKGVGPKTAASICRRFGSDTFEVILNEPERLTEIRGISPARAEQIGAEFARLNSLRMLSLFLASHELPLELAAPLIKTYGSMAVPMIQTNPWLLCQDPFNADFADCDRLAEDFGLDMTCPMRLEAAIIYELFFNSQNGHAFVPRDKLAAVSSALTAVDTDHIYPAITELEESGKIITDDSFSLTACYLPHLHTAESYIASAVSRLNSLKLVPPARLDRMLAASEKSHGISYSEKQKNAIKMCFEHGISLITGGPGTGKTTALLTMLELIEQCGLNAMLTAPTGRAAKRMSELSGREAKTIHRLLETGFDQQSGRPVFKHNENDPLDTDILIVDEASMIELGLASSMLRALKPHTRLVLIGDADQLPPIGAGNFFADLLASELPQTRLTEIFRQAEKSRIVMNAHLINRGEMPVISDKTGDFFFGSERSAESTASNVLSLLTKRIPDHFGIRREDIQVICPSRIGPVGTASLNRLIQAEINPPAEDKAEVRTPSGVLRIGDKVMQVRNNYDLIWTKTEGGEMGSGIFNGDTGTVCHIDAASRILIVRFEDRDVEYTFDGTGDLELAYAITTHKAQGSEYQAVIIPVHSVPQRLLYRSLIYTAVTRAKKLLVMVGRSEIIKTMVDSNLKTKRYSFLKRRIAEEI